MTLKTGFVIGLFFIGIFLGVVIMACTAAASKYNNKD